MKSLFSVKMISLIIKFTIRFYFHSKVVLFTIHELCQLCIENHLNVFKNPPCVLIGRDSTNGRGQKALTPASNLLSLDGIDKELFRLD